jgi:membrane-bound metal-dependent hydrolase YbcI (DUF457 family)
LRFGFSTLKFSR